MRLLAAITLLAAAVASALPTNEVLTPRQSPANVYKLPGNAWIETLAVRPNGQILMARLDVPELWSLDPATKTGSKLLSFTGALSLTGITEIQPDIFAVVSGNFSTRGFSVKAGSWAVWKVDLTGSAPKATQVKLVPESGFFIGVAPLNNDTILIADAGKATLYKMALSTGEYGVVLADNSMKAPASGVIVEGIHGLSYHDGYAYFTNTFGSGFYKLKVDESGKASGTPTEIANLAAPEGLTFGPDGNAYVAQLNAGVVVRVTPDGKTNRVASVASCSSVAFGRGGGDKNTLYISTSNGAVMSADGVATS